MSPEKPEEKLGSDGAERGEEVEPTTIVEDTKNRQAGSREEEEQDEGQAVRQEETCWRSTKTELLIQRLLTTRKSEQTSPVQGAAPDEKSSGRTGGGATG